MAHAGGQTTRAITIHAPIEDAWPWLAQLGQDRGGFYSFDLLENGVGCQMPTVDVLRARHQVWQLGDKLWMYPSDQAGGVGFATLRVYQPGRVLGFATRAIGTSPDHAEDGSWTFVLEPVNPQTTRLVVRGRGAARPSLLGAAFDRTIFEPVHFVMERRMMMGLKELAETGTRNRRLNHIHILLWTVTLGLFVVAAFMVLRRADWKGPLLGLVAAAAAFQILTLVQPPLIVGVLLVGLTGWVLFRLDGRPTDALQLHGGAAIGRSPNQPTSPTVPTALRELESRFSVRACGWASPDRLMLMPGPHAAHNQQGADDERHGGANSTDVGGTPRQPSGEPNHTAKRR